MSFYRNIIQLNNRRLQAPTETSRFWIAQPNGPVPVPAPVPVPIPQYHLSDRSSKVIVWIAL